MSDDQLNLSPRAGFIATYPRHTAFEAESWRLLYQPILGVAAFSLYSALRSFITERPQLSNREQHSELLSWLGIDMPAFLTARQRLEAAGLLASFYQQDAIGELYVYRLRLPLSAHEFFADDLLSVLLLQTVGQDRYDALLDLFAPVPLVTDKMQNVSADFLTVFRVSGQQLADRPAQLPATEIPEKDGTEKRVDFKLLADFLKSEYVDLDSVTSHQDLLTAEAQLYGLTERELANLVIQATSVTTNKFDEKQFKAIVAAQFQASQQTMVEAAPADVSKQTNATGQLVALISAAKSYAPADFLATLKQEKGQYVTDAEQRTLTKFMTRKIFAPSVVNMLIYYLINDREQNVLYQNSLDSVANDWAKAKVATPEQAVEHMRAYAQQQATRQRQRQSGQPQKSREKLPDWNEQPDSDAATTAADSARIAALREQLNNAKQDRKEES